MLICNFSKFSITWFAIAEAATKRRDLDSLTQRPRKFAGTVQKRFQVEILTGGEWMQLETLSANVSTPVMVASVMSMIILPLFQKVVSLWPRIVKFFRAG